MCDTSQLLQLPFPHQLTSVAMVVTDVFQKSIGHNCGNTTADTAVATIYKTTTTTTPATSSNSAVMKIKEQYEEKSEVRRGKEGKRVEKEDRVNERENEQGEVSTG